VKAFAALLDSLVFTTSRNGKLRHLAGYFETTPDPQRGYALAALTGGLSFRGAKAGQIRELGAEGFGRLQTHAPFGVNSHADHPTDPTRTEACRVPGPACRRPGCGNQVRQVGVVPVR